MEYRGINKAEEIRNWSSAEPETSNARKRDWTLPATRLARACGQDSGCLADGSGKERCLML